MWSRESPMKEYARKHPGCSLQEYCEYLDNIAREEAERRRLKEEENNQLLKSFEGKCFQINFNRQSFGYFKITKDITALREDVKEDFYEVFIDSNTTRISLEKKRMINRQWLPGQASEKCTIVPEELFNVKYYQEMCTMAEKIRDGFYSDEIIAIDKKLNVIVTKNGNEINYYWIKDPNSKPSLYRTGRYDSLVL